MRINESRPIAATNPYRRQAELASKSNTIRHSTKDEANFSTEALNMFNTSKQSEADRAQKIQQLKAQVATGTYQVDAGKVAEKLLPFLL